MTEIAGDARERRVGSGRSALDDPVSRRSPQGDEALETGSSSASPEEERIPSARPGASAHNPNRQAVMYCPYCAEETLFPLERGWECRSCLRAFSVSFIGLVSRDRARQEQV